MLRAILVFNLLKTRIFIGDINPFLVLFSVRLIVLVLTQTPSSDSLWR